MSLKDELLRNVASFWRSAELVHRSGDWTSATILYFKALFVLLDYILLTSGHDIPKDHTERFRLLERHAPKLYGILDQLYPVYRDTYSTAVHRHECEEVRNNVSRLIKEAKIQV